MNRRATEMLLAVTRFTARDVPLLRSSVVIAGHDRAGHLAGLDDHQMRRLITSELTRGETRVLNRRFNRDAYLQRERRVVRRALLRGDGR